ncbi:flagellin [Hydrogenovibrio marinus]|uniref:Flagellin n=1 Tax=Hydrogenovibrio marinus TaxID=28885 RepID=A0A066ZZK9_HYDMR|nr:flagellin [Hydrogenovibrio marinus]KDN95555.1 flagellin-like protein [Hydrogenovibrio marinus]BBN60049.1 flagellin [Hydrogenovibrio marinus]
MSIDSISNYNATTYASLQQSLASGSRINTSADDAAGKAVVTALTTQIGQQDIATRNANDGISALQIADSTGENIGNQLLRLGELATQAQNGTYSDAQRQTLNQEFQQGLQAINQYVGQASFNGINLLDGSQNTLSIGLGDSTNALTFPNLTTNAQGLNGLDITSTANASNAYSSITTALENLSTSRSQLGAQQNGLASTVENLATQNVNAQSSRSQINDTDYAKALTQLSKQQVLEQSSIAMQAQSNQNRSNVLQLLQS